MRDAASTEPRCATILKSHCRSEETSQRGMRAGACRRGANTGHTMYLPKNASRARQREAQNARDNRAEIIKALSHGQITRRDLYKWGLLTATGGMVMKHGLNALAPSAYAADIPTGTPRSPLGTATKFSVEMPRLALQIPYTPHEKSGDR